MAIVKAWERVAEWFKSRRTVRALDLVAHPVCFVCRRRILIESQIRGVEEPGNIRLFGHAECIDPLKMPLWEMFSRYTEARADDTFVTSQYGGAPV